MLCFFIVCIAGSVGFETLPGESWIFLLTFCIYNLNHVNTLCSVI